VFSLSAIRSPSVSLAVSDPTPQNGRIVLRHRRSRYDHCGLGAGTKNMLRLPRRSRPRPTIVVISLGTNDEYLNATAGRAESDELNSLVSQIKSVGATISWVGPPPLPPTYSGNHPSGVVIPMIASAASSQGFNFFPGNQLNIPRQSADKLHPTPRATQRGPISFSTGSNRPDPSRLAPASAAPYDGVHAKIPKTALRLLGLRGAIFAMVGALHGVRRMEHGERGGAGLRKTRRASRKGRREAGPRGAVSRDRGRYGDAAAVIRLGRSRSGPCRRIRRGERYARRRRARRWQVNAPCASRPCARARGVADSLRDRRGNPLLRSRSG